MKEGLEGEGVEERADLLPTSAFLCQQQGAPHQQDAPYTIPLLGVRFFAGSFEQATETLLQSVGLVVFPSGPSLAHDLWEDDTYRLALQTADLAFADSGAMVLLWKIFSGQKIPRYSGLRMLTDMCRQPAFCQKGATFWVMPSQAQQAVNLEWLRKMMPISEEDCYCAPRYGAGPIRDPILLEILRKRRPRFVILCVGGGVQERLGHFLRNHLGRTRPVSILCTGAAIGFLSGNQAHIPPWADFFFLGWLFRCISSPKIFIPRYLKALALIKAIFRYWLFGPPPRTSMAHPGAC